MRGGTGMNFCAPIARGTRAQEALYFRAQYEQRRKRNGGGGSSSNGRKSEEKSNGEKVRVRDSQTFENKKSAISLDSDCDEDEPVQVDDRGSISLKNAFINRTVDESKHAQENHSVPAISIDKDEDEAVQVEGGGSISLNKNVYNYKAAEHSICAEKQFSSSSDDGDVYGDDGDRLSDVKGGRFDDAEEEDDQTFPDNGDKGSFSECNGRKSGKSDRDEVKARDSPMLEREKAKPVEIDPVRCYSVPISLESEEDDEAAEIGNEDRGMKGGKTFVSIGKDSSSVEDRISSSEDEEDSEGTYDVKAGKFEEDDEDEEEEEEEDQKRSFKVNASIPSKKRGTNNPISYVGYGCVTQRTRSRAGWRSSVRRNSKFETAKGIHYSSGSSMDAHHHGVEEVEEVEMKDGGAAVKGGGGGGIDFYFVSSDTEDDMPYKSAINVNESASSSESEDGDEEDSDDTYEEGDEEEVHGEEEEEEEEEEEDEEEKSVESPKRKNSSKVQDKWKTSQKKGKNEEEVEVEVEEEEERNVESLKRKRPSKVQVSVSVEKDKWKTSEKENKNEKLQTVTPQIKNNEEIVKVQASLKLPQVDEAKFTGNDTFTFKASHGSGCPKERNKCQSPRRDAENIASTSKPKVHGEKANEEACHFTSQFSYCFTNIRSYCLGVCQYLAVSTAFVKMLPPETKNMMLQNANGKSWPVKYSYSSRSRISCGWTSFANDNHIKLGDICVFELVQKDILKVHIFRC